MSIKEQVVDSLPLNNDQLLTQIKSFSPKQLQWLSGYCAGLAESSVSTPLDVPQTALAASLNTVAKPKVLVLFASQTGNAESVAEQLQAKLQNGYDVTLQSTLDIKLKQLSNYSIIFVIASTHGEGEPPDDAIDFHEAIFSKKAPKLNDVKHAVLGLGDSSYEFFCQTAKDFDNALSKLGSKALIDRIDCDVDYEEEADSWINTLVAELAQLQPDITNAQQAVAPVASVASIYSKANPYAATVSSLQKITGAGSSKETYHLEIDLADSAIEYQPGDAIGIWANNSQSLVNEILKVLSINSEELVKFQDNELTIHQALTTHLELTLLNKGTLEALATLTDSQAIKAIIENYASYVKDHQLIDALLLLESPITAQQLVDILKPIKSRLYSIASSLEENPEEVHITLNHVVNHNDNGERYGLASHYLTQTLEEGDSVNIYIDHNKNFKLPNSDTDIILIGAGTGVAPYRAFLQERELQEAPGNSWLFFGNPHFNTDFLYQTEIQKFLKDKVLTNIDLAFSRDQAEKVYVQDKLLEQQETLWQWIENGAAIYVCGDMSRMAKDVEATLLTVISQQGNLNAEQAKEYLKQLKKESRYQRDVY